MDVVIVISLLGVALLAAELLLPTGGVLAVLGAAGLIVGGVIALGEDSAASEYVGPGLITVGVLSILTFFFVARKVLAAHRDERVRTGPEELVGAGAEARTALDPEGQVWIEGALWAARLADGEGRASVGDRVTVEAVEGLTLLVRTGPPPTNQAEQGAS